MISADVQDKFKRTALTFQAEENGLWRMMPVVHRVPSYQTVFSDIVLLKTDPFPVRGLIDLSKCQFSCDESFLRPPVAASDPYLFKWWTSASRSRF